MLLIFVESQGNWKKHILIILPLKNAAIFLNKKMADHPHFMHKAPKLKNLNNEEMRGKKFKILDTSIFIRSGLQNLSKVRNHPDHNVPKRYIIEQSGEIQCTHWQTFRKWAHQGTPTLTTQFFSNPSLTFPNLGVHFSISIGITYKKSVQAKHIEKESSIITLISYKALTHIQAFIPTCKPH